MNIEQPTGYETPKKPTTAPSSGVPTGADHLSRGPAGGPPPTQAAGTQAPPRQEEDSIDVTEWIQSTKSQVETTVRKHPYATVAAAAGLGYVLGGGMPRWTTTLLVRYATKTAIAAAVAAVAAETATDETLFPTQETS